jgi:hypothetical protein
METSQLKDLRPQLQLMFEEQSFVFRVNVAFGFVLFNNTEEEYRYYYASQNNRLLDYPPLIRNQQDFDEFLNNIENIDVLEWARGQRPNSKWIVHLLTNSTIYVDKLLKFPIG